MRRLKDVTPVMEAKMLSVFQSCVTREQKDLVTDWILRTFGQSYAFTTLFNSIRIGLEKSLKSHLDGQTTPDAFNAARDSIMETLRGNDLINSNHFTRVLPEMVFINPDDFELVSKEEIMENFCNDKHVEIPQPEMIITKGFKDV